MTGPGDAGDAGGEVADALVESISICALCLILSVRAMHAGREYRQPAPSGTILDGHALCAEHLGSYVKYVGAARKCACGNGVRPSLFEVADVTEAVEQSRTVRPLRRRPQ